MEQEAEPFLATERSDEAKLSHANAAEDVVKTLWVPSTEVRKTANDFVAGVLVPHDMDAAAAAAKVDDTADGVPSTSKSAGLPAVTATSFGKKFVASPGEKAVQVQQQVVPTLPHVQALYPELPKAHEGPPPDAEAHQPATLLPKKILRELVRPMQLDKESGEEWQTRLHAEATLLPEKMQKLIRPMLPLIEPPPEVINPMARGMSRSASEACLEAPQAPAADSYLYSHFDQGVQRLGLHVCWGEELPSVERVIDGGEAEKRGVMARDFILEINGIQAKGKGKAVLNPLLEVRPLTLKLIRKVTCH